MNTFEERYADIKQGIAPFRLKRDFETIKTVSAVNALADRADMLRRGCAPGVFHEGSAYTCPPGTEPEPMMRKAERYLAALKRGEYPLAGCFSEPGCTFVDHTFIEENGVLHVFYNRGYIGFDWAEQPHDTFGHAWTTDLVHWSYGAPALSVSDAPYMNYQVWAPAVIRHDGRFWMYFTGVNRHVCQATCAAVSDDLFRWRPLPENPVYIPGDWCPWSPDRWSNCRDIFVLKDGDTFYQYFCTERYTETGTESASGILKSDDLLRWEECGTFHMPSCDHAAESPFVIRHDGRYYFFYTNCGIGTCYAVGDSPCGEWTEMGPLMAVTETPADLAWVPSCAEVICFKGEWYISCCLRQPGWEQYLELYRLYWNDDGTVTVGERLSAPDLTEV